MVSRSKRNRAGNTRMLPKTNIEWVNPAYLKDSTIRYFQ